jgi:predicted ester cyclase
MGEALETAKRHDEAFNTRDPDGRKATEAADIESVLPGGMTLRGPEQTLAVAQSFWEAIPDGTITSDRQIEVGDLVVAEGYLIGTHSGPFRTPQGEVPPSGNQVKLRYASIKQVEAGRITSEHLYFDQLEFMQQIGAMPASPTEASG